MQTKEAFKKCLDELRKAEKKFPTYPIDPIHAACVVAEESGELQQAVLQQTYEGGLPDNTLKEAFHTMASALRFIINFEDMKTRPSKQI